MYKTLAQNLIENPSFEDTVQCPSLPGQIFLSTGWTDATLASADYFNLCAPPPYYSVPLNQYGYQLAKSGSAYAGIATYNTINFREYLQKKLSISLDANKRYCVEFFVNLPDTVFVAANNIGAYFSQTATTGPVGSVLNVIPQINNNPIANPLTDKIGWTKVSGSFVASGGEEYITIGNFKDDASTDTTYVGGGFCCVSSYYYIDDVSVICCDCEDTLNIPNIFTPNGDGINDVFKIENLPEKVSVKIYNRWGIQVFESAKPATFWDGRTISGEECTEGVYFYIINTEEKSYKGYLQLVR